MRSTSAPAGEASEQHLSRRLVVTLAIATGVAVANGYYAQPLLAAIRHSFHTSAGETGLIVTASQIGYAAGLVFLLPLGDLLERRRLVVVMSLVTAAGLVGAAFSPVLPALFGAAAIVGANSVVAQVLVAFSASLAGDSERGRVVGTVMSGLLLGILLARTAAGYIAEASSWRVVFVVAAVLMALLAAVLRNQLPAHREPERLSYPAVLASVVALMRAERVLRRRSLYGSLSFAAFSVLWTSLAFLLSSTPYHYATGTIGLFGLAGVAGAAMAQVSGRLADRGHQAAVTVFTCFAMLVAFAIMGLGRDLVGVLVAGIVVLDLGCQGLHITNQSEIYRLAPNARSRVNSAYMTSYFIGGTLGSVGSALCYAAGGWGAVCALGAGLGAVAAALSLTEVRYSREGSSKAAVSGAPAQPPATAGTTETV